MDNDTILKLEYYFNRIGKPEMDILIINHFIKCYSNFKFILNIYDLNEKNNGQSTRWIHYMHNDYFYHKRLLKYDLKKEHEER